MKMKQNMIRGKIIEFLHHIYPEGADQRSLVSCFYEYHKYDDIVQALEYLADKGYISRKEFPHPYKKNERVSLYKLTANGMDLYEGTIVDPAVPIIAEES